MREETLTAALRAAMEDDLAALWAAPEGEEPDWSPAYRAWETDFLARRAVPARAPRRWGRTLLVAAAVLAVLVTGAVAAAPWIQNAVLRQSGTSLNFIYTPAGTEPIPLGEWRPAWLPEGLVLNSAHEETADGGAWVSYRIEGGTSLEALEAGTTTYLTLFYDALDEEFGAGVTTRERLEVTEVRVNGWPGYLWSDGEYYHSLTWIDEEARVGFVLDCLGPDRKVLLQVAESVELIP